MQEVAAQSQSVHHLVIADLSQHHLVSALPEVKQHYTDEQDI